MTPGRPSAFSRTSERTQRLDAALAARKAYSSGAMHPAQVFDHLVYGALSELERQVYDLVASGCNTSAEIVERVGKTQVHVGTVLRYLTEKGVLAREERRGTRYGRYYVYSTNLKWKRNE